ncbi:hypothetical protein AMTRI_Chr02g255900 [Amborella trichopoda]
MIRCFINNAAKPKLKLKVKVQLQLQPINTFHRPSSSAQDNDNHLYSSLVNNLTSCTTLRYAHLSHLQAITSGFSQDIFLCNTIINTYINNGGLQQAQQIFENMPFRNSVSWSSIITGHVRYGLSYEAIGLFRRMIREGFEPTKFTFGITLRACEDSLNIQMGRQVHGLIAGSPWFHDIVVCNVLMGMYAGCNQIDLSRKVFDEMLLRNLISWNTMISIYSRSSDYGSLIELFSEMKKFGMEPNQYTFTSLIAGCPSHSKQIMTHVLKSGYMGNVYVGSAMVNTYAKGGMLYEAKKLFEEMEERNVVSVNGLMVGYVQCDHGREAIKLYCVMRAAENRMNLDSILILISACACIDGGMKQGKEVHCHVIRMGWDYDISTWNGLINMYAKHGAIDRAMRVFDLMEEKDAVSWNAMISGLDQNGCHEQALKTIYLMQKMGANPSNITVVSTLSSCASLGSIEQGEQIHCNVIKLGLEEDVSVSNSLLTMYARSGNLEGSQKVFATMTEHDQVSWNAMIGAYADAGHAKEALQLFCSMMQSGCGLLNRITVLNLLTALSLSNLELKSQVHALVIKCGLEGDNAIENALLSSYSKSGAMEDSEHLFTEMSIRDEVSWNSMIVGYVQNGPVDKAMEVLQTMIQKGIRMDHFTYASTLSACALIAALEQGMQIHASCIRASLGFDVVVESSVLDMYAKCGRIDYASKAFNLMSLRNEFSWNSMISGYARHGHGEQALELFKKFEQEPGRSPDHVTFVGVLSACSHGGLLEQGFEYFNLMREKYGLTPRVEHYACMVDLFGRAGELRKAEGFIKSMPMEPSSLVWRTFLGACRVHGDTILGNQAANKLIELEPQDPVSYVLASNMYASGERWDDVAKTRAMMRGNQVKKEPGCSWVVMKDGIHVFVSGDMSHPNIDEIYAKLKMLTRQMRAAGYVPETKFALYDLEMESKEELLSYHSEKLAIAFVLTRSSEKTIRIIKNLRVCGDCHKAFKYISEIVGRQIVLRDSNRFHHFEDGKCSCRDYW